MAIYDYLPQFNYIEPNNLKGLQPGFVVAQVDCIDANLWNSEDEGGFNNTKVFENGVICTLKYEDADSCAYIAVPDADTRVIFIHFSEPLNTVFNSDKYFAIKVEGEDDATFRVASEECPRLVQLMPGDEWMSKNPVNTDLEGRIVEIKHEKGWYSVGMPNGEEGHHYMFLG